MPGSPRPFIVFYAWQSDLPETANRYLLRDALRDAAKRLKGKLPREFSEVVIDEATRNLPGSPNIPAAIQQKILAADAVVCDVSTVLRSAGGAKERAAPNPNVVFELGFAVANHGWERTVMLLNEEHGSFDDLPFDFDRHRAGSFRCAAPDDQDGNSAATQLAEARSRVSETAYLALRAIIEHQPPRPADLRGVSPEQIKRRHDVDTLRDLFRTVHWPTLDEFVESAPKHYWTRSLHFHAGLFGYLSASLFHLYDPRARELVEMFAQAWNEALGIASDFVRDNGRDRFIWPMPGDVPFTDQREQRQWNRAQRAVRRMAKSSGALLQHVREHYPEINVKETSQEAWREFQVGHGE
jgi:hypothetical protein